MVHIIWSILKLFCLSGITIIRLDNARGQNCSLMDRIRYLNRNLNDKNSWSDWFKMVNNEELIFQNHCHEREALYGINYIKIKFNSGIWKPLKYNQFSTSIWKTIDSILLASWNRFCQYNRIFVAIIWSCPVMNDPCQIALKDEVKRFRFRNIRKYWRRYPSF